MQSQGCYDKEKKIVLTYAADANIHQEATQCTLEGPDLEGSSKTTQRMRKGRPT